MKDYKKILLKNNLPLILAPQKNGKTVTALIMVRTGSKNESRQERGLSHFLEHMFFKGTKKYPNTLALSTALDLLGGEYNAFTSKEYTGYYLKVRAGKLKPSLEILGDMLLNSKFEAKEIEREKGVIIEELNMYENNPMMKIESLLEACLYGDNSSGWDIIGTKKSIQSFKREDFLRYYRKQYGSESMAVILSGSFNQEEEDLAKKIFSKIKKAQWQKWPELQEKQKEVRIKIAQKKTEQINLALAFRLSSAGAKDELALKLFSLILGGSMSSRLFISLRERSGLAYYVRSSTQFYSNSGYLSIQAGVPKSKLKKSLEIIIKELKLLKKNGIKAEELARAKDIYTGRLALRMEASDELAAWYGQQFILNKDLSSTKELEKKINQISLKELNQLAEKYIFSQNLSLALIGDIKKEAKNGLLKILNF